MNATSSLAPFHAVITKAGDVFRQSLQQAAEAGGLTIDQYVRYLQMQYHLTKNVQRYFLLAAAHPSLEGRRAFRNFLVSFGLEEEPHYAIAKNDLRTLGYDVGDATLDVKLWHAYFTNVVEQRPFVRLGAAGVLETIGSLASEQIKGLLKNAPFLADNCTRFVVIHMHETTPWCSNAFGTSKCVSVA